jgi:predicted RNA-binding Zn ribbon-like protein
LNEAAQRAGVRLRFAPDVSAGLRPSATGVDGAIGVVLSVTAVAMVEGTWNRLKVCPAPDCRWAFYDGSKNRGGVWCQMAECGNRHKVRAHRSRQASAVQP